MIVWDVPPLWVPPAVIRPAEHALLRPGAFRPCTRAEGRAILADLVRSGRMTREEAKRAVIFIPWIASEAATNPWTLIAHTFAVANGTTDGTSATINSTGGNLIVLGVIQNSADVPSDNKSNTAEFVTSHIASSTYASVYLYYIKDPTVGTGHTFTVKGTYGAMGVLVFSGAATSPIDPLDQYASDGALSAGSITPTLDWELIFSVSRGNETFTVDSGLTITDQITNVANTHHPASFAYLFQEVAAAIDPTWSTSDSAVATATASFKSIYG